MGTDSKRNRGIRRKVITLIITFFYVSIKIINYANYGETYK